MAKEQNILLAKMRIYKTAFWGNGVGTVQLFERHMGGERLVDAVRAENVGCEYGEYC